MKIKVTYYFKLNVILFYINYKNCSKLWLFDFGGSLVLMKSLYQAIIFGQVFIRIIKHLLNTLFNLSYFFL